MAGIYKLIFDLSLYYTLTGFYLVVFFRKAPSALGMMLLCAVVLLDALMRRQKFDLSKRALLLALPLPALIVWPGIWPAIHLLPAWFYIGWCLITGRFNPEYDEFRSHYGFGLRLLLLMLPAFIICKWVGEAFLAVVPYLALMLSVGVCLLRMLREATRSGVKQALFISAFVLGCALLTAGRAPQMVMAVAKFLYQNIVAVVLLGTAMLLAIAFYGLINGFFWLVSVLGGENEQVVDMNIMSAADMLGLEEEFVDQSGDIAWLRVALYVLVAVAVLLALFFIFRRLLGNRNAQDKDDLWSEQRESVDPGSRKRRRGVLRPRDPRMAVRYYYAKFLAESRRRGMYAKPGCTNQELAAISEPLFPGADTHELADVYAPARYRERAPVSQADADRAQAAWRSLKKTKSPMEKVK